MFMIGVLIVLFSTLSLKWIRGVLYSASELSIEPVKCVMVPDISYGSSFRRMLVARKEAAFRNGRLLVSHDKIKGVGTSARKNLPVNTNGCLSTASLIFSNWRILESLLNSI